MKKLALAICLLVVSIAAQAQFEKGKMILNPSVTGLDFSYNKNDKATFGIGAQAGTFLADGIALMVNLGADWSKPVDEYTLGTGMRFYFNSTGVYLGGGLDWNRSVTTVDLIVPIGDWVSKPDTPISSLAP